MRKVIASTLLLVSTISFSNAHAEWAPAKKADKNADAEWAPGKNSPSSSETQMHYSSKQAVSIGLLSGGGGLVGLDYEMLIANRLGIQLGAGFVSYSVGLNFHAEPKINSSFVSLAYWDQGAGGEVSAQLAGLSYNYRSTDGWLTWQLGIGKVLSYTSAFEQNFQDILDTEVPNVMLVYSIGGYFDI